MYVWFGTFHFGDLSQTEKLSEINPPLQFNVTRKLKEEIFSLKFKEESKQLVEVPPICSNPDNIDNVNLTITTQNMKIVPYEAFVISDVFVNKTENDFNFYIGPNFNNSQIFQIQCSEKGFLSNFIMDVKFNVTKEFVGIDRPVLLLRHIWFVTFQCYIGNSWWVVCFCTYRKTKF